MPHLPLMIVTGSDQLSCFLSFLYCLCSFAANPINIGFPCSSTIDPFYFSLNKDDLSVLSWFQWSFPLLNLFISDAVLPQTFMCNFLLLSLGMSCRPLTLNTSQTEFIFLHLPQASVFPLSMNKPTFLPVIILLSSLYSTTTRSCLSFVAFLLAPLPLKFNLDYCLGHCSSNLLTISPPFRVDVSLSYIGSDFLF